MTIMSWNIAESKQRLSEVVRAARGEPQLICNRGRPVAALLDIDEFEAFRAWRESGPHTGSLADAFVEVRGVMAEDAYELLILPRSDRDSGFDVGGDPDVD